jgi:hypothetical protein
MVKLFNSVIAAFKRVLEIGFVGDGQIQAEDARIIDLLIGTEATRNVGVFVE